MAGGPLGGAGGVARANPAQVGDELTGGVRAPQSCRYCPQGCRVAVQAAVLCGLPEAGEVAGAGCAGGEGVPQGGRAQLVLAGAAAVLVKVVGDLVAGHAGARRGRDGLQGPHRSLELLGGPGQRGVAPAFDAGGALRAGQVPDRSFLDERGGQRAGVAEPDGVHRRGDDRLAVRVTAGPVITVQQVRDPGQVLGDLPVLPGARGRRGRFCQHRIAGPGRGFQVGGGKPWRDVDDPAADGIDRGGVAAGELGQRLQQPPGRPGRIGGPGLEPRARRGGISVPLLRPHGGDEQAALTNDQVGQAAQHLRAAVGVGVLAQLTQP